MFKRNLIVIFIMAFALLNAQVAFLGWDFNGESMSPTIGTGMDIELIGDVSSDWAAGWGGGTGNRALNTSRYPSATSNPETAGIQVFASTVGYSNISISWNQRNSNAAANRTRLQYTIDGNTWINFNADETNATNVHASQPPTGHFEPFDNGMFIATNPNSGTPSWFRRTVDFSSLEGVNNNQNFAVRFVTAFPTGSSTYVGTEINYGSGGTIRFDNILFYEVAPPIVISSLSELREFTPGTPQNRGAIYHIVNEVLVTFAQDWRNQKFVQDNTDAILIDDESNVITAVYNIGDGMSGLLATLGFHGGALQLQPVASPGSPSSTGNQITPKTITMEQFMNDFEMLNSQLVTIQNVSFVEPTGTFFNGREYVITDGIFFINMRTTFFDVDYIRQPIPSETFTMTGIVNSRMEGEVLQQFITPRFARDMNMTVSEGDIVSIPGHKLIGNFPNPFNPNTTIAFYLDRDTDVNITIFNIRGQKIKTLADGSFTAGYHNITWDGTDANARFMASGVYFYIMETSETVHYRRAILMK